MTNKKRETAETVCIVTAIGGVTIAFCGFIIGGTIVTIISWIGVGLVPLSILVAGFLGSKYDKQDAKYDEVKRGN